MKVINAFTDKIARLECSCCGEEHYIEFNMPKKKYIDDETMVCVKFTDTEFSLRQRVRNALTLYFRKKYLKENTEFFSSVLFDYNELADLYSTLKLEYEQNDLLKDGDIDNNFKAKLEELTLYYKNDLREYSLFKSKEGLIIGIMLQEYNGKTYVQDMSIGFSLVSENLSTFNIIKRGIKFIFNPKYNRIFTNYELTLHKDEFITFMNVLNWMLNNFEEKQNCSFFHVEVKDATNIIREQ